VGTQEAVPRGTAVASIVPKAKLAATPVLRQVKVATSARVAPATVDLNFGKFPIGVARCPWHLPPS
jgi:hypothetical protein